MRKKKSLNSKPKKPTKPVVENKSKSLKLGSIKRPQTSSRQTRRPNHGGKAFPIVGMGASAGGLPAVVQVLKKLPANPGPAFVVIQHLDPAHESLTAEILSRATAMPVQEAEDGMAVQPNHVYVLPPNSTLALQEGALKLLPRENTRGPHMPIDFFFQSLAEARKELALGVVLSGNASDGTKGLQAIKAEGGFTFAQDPETAKFDGMPKSAILSGAVDFILPPEGIAKEISEIAHHPQLALSQLPDSGLPNDKDGSLAKIFSILKKGTHSDFTLYKQCTVQRRIARRLLLLKVDSLKSYVKYLEKHPEEVTALFEDVLIHVTEFFRDPKVFEALKAKIFPKLFKNRDNNLPFRIWVPGCSTGEEAYSIAICFYEFLESIGSHTPVQIFATDVSEAAIQTARAGFYTNGLVKGVSKERLHKYFETVEGGYRIAKWVRDVCLFSKHDVTSNPPFAKLDLVSCRNLLLYFSNDLQRRVLPIFHYALLPSGMLWLGRSESVAGFASLFAVVDKKNKFYLKKNASIRLNIPFQTSSFPGNKVEISKISDINLRRQEVQRVADRMALQEYVPPCVVINDAMEIIQTRGRTAPYLELSPGQASLNLLKMARPEMVADLRSMVQSARKKGVPVKREDLDFGENGKRRIFSLKVVPFRPFAQANDIYYTIYFEKAVAVDLPKVPKRGKKSGIGARIQGLKGQQNELQKRLLVSQEYQQSLIEEYEATQEELTSSNEELQSTNEEMQCSNEELETAKEELQSANEELTTVNDELQVRNLEMTQVTSDLTNLLSSVDIPVVMVGLEGDIRRFTPKSGKVFRLISSDIGRLIGDIRSDLSIPNLEELVSEVIRSSSVKEVDAVDRQGYAYRLQVRPCITSEGKVDGAVVALIDIDALKKGMDQLKKARDDAATIIETMPLPLLVLNMDRTVRLANQSFYQKFQVSKEETEGRPISDLGNGQWNIPSLLSVIETTLLQGTEFNGFEVDHDFPNIGLKMMTLNARRVHLSGSGADAALLAIEDFTEKKKVEISLKASEEKYRNLMITAHDAIVIVNAKGTIEFANRKAEELFGYSLGELLGKNYEIFVPARFKNIHEKHHDRYVEAPVSRGMGSGIEILGVKKNGAEFPIEVSLSPVRSRDDVIVTCVIRDITESKRIDSERQRLLEKEVILREEAEKANRIKDEFLATLSHELRTPLTAILTWSQILRLGKADSEKVQQGLAIIEQSSKIQGQLIDDLLDISRIRSGKLALELREMDPTSAVHAAVDSVQGLAAKKKIKFKMEQEPELGLIFADPGRVQQVFWNLFTNAIKFSPEDSAVFVKMCRIKNSMGDWFQSQVIDTGKGISQEFLPRIFEKFSQADSTSTRVFGGLGLGLAIVRNLVEMQGGTVSVASEGEGKGAIFTVRFPLRSSLLRPVSGISEATVVSESDDMVPAKLDGLRILVVDDEEAARDAFALILQEFGADVRKAASVAEALRVFAEFRPNILLSDIGMPNEDGYSLIRKIRALDEKDGGKIPALALTAYAGAEDIHRALTCGFNQHLTKPVQAVVLSRALAKLGFQAKAAP